MHKSTETRPVKPRRNMLRQYCAECEEEATKEIVIELEHIVAVRRLCDRCATAAARFDFALA